MAADRDCTPMGPPPRAVGDRLAMLLVHTGNHLLQQAEEQLATIGIEPRDYMALALLDRDRPRSQLELAQLMTKAPALVVGVVDGLERRGLAVRERDPSDRRRSVVRITPKGTKVLAKADAIAAGIEQGGLAGLDDEDRAQLLDLLQRAARPAAVPDPA
jgi:DNA-binding MarR family transcriptional regulator